MPHLGKITVGLDKGVKIGQGRDIEITTRQTLPMQIDGEPWRQRPCTLRISRNMQYVLILLRNCVCIYIFIERKLLLRIKCRSVLYQHTASFAPRNSQCVKKQERYSDEQLSTDSLTIVKVY